ncbi:hypothetical protein LZ30DRAFT_297372 [Colletotrichum cereale]|nr:hypothetical protein LZ30DRAFT_297372 [Colletotrichum cereale]
MVSESEKEERLLHELLGNSRDKHLGRLLDARAHSLIEALDCGDNGRMQELCSEDVTLITGYRGGEKVHKGIHEITQFSHSYTPSIHVIITIVDRRRIICPVEVFTDNYNGSHTQQRKVMIFDVDDAGKIKRIEMRPLGEIGHGTGDVSAAVAYHEGLSADNGL